MGLLSFIKEAGEKLFYHDAAGAATLSEDQLTTANGRAADAIKSHVEAQGPKATGLIVTYDGVTGTVTVYGIAPDQQTKEKVVLSCGNVRNVESVNDQMTAADQSEPEAQYYIVVKGDTLSKISKQYYGNPNTYNAIFEANKPMLKTPDLIYPGLMLRIPRMPV
jgi:nucleoid-associated protein YgaU